MEGQMDIKIDLDFEAVYRTLELDGERDKNSFLSITKLNQVFNRLHKSNGAPVYIFGLGVGGRNIIGSMIFDGILSGIIDNDSKKWGEHYNGLNILSPDILKDKKNALIFVISDWFHDIRLQLINIGISDENIINVMPIYTAYQWLLETSPIEYYISSCEGI